MDKRCGRCGDKKKLTTEGEYKGMLCDDCALLKVYEKMEESK